MDKEGIDMEVKVLEAYKCPHCYEIYQDRHRADNCLYHHLKEVCINNDFQRGMSLYSINYTYAMHWQLSKAQEAITKDNCFVISYLQCCDHPAYQISHIDAYGRIKVSGCGSWSGYYSSIVALDCLSEPMPLEKLYVDPRFK